MDLETARSYPLSNEDIQHVLNPDTRIWTYPQLANLRHIDELFDSLGRCILLYGVASASSGHWVAMLKRGNTVEYFDPYGLAPEAPRSWVSRQQEHEMGQSTPFLTNLLRSSGYKVTYNTFPYQSSKASVATCGRWAVTRLILKDIDARRFYDAVMRESKKRRISPDDFATAYVVDVLGF